MALQKCYYGPCHLAIGCGAEAFGTRWCKGRTDLTRKGKPYPDPARVQSSTVRPSQACRCGSRNVTPR